MRNKPFLIATMVLFAALSVFADPINVFMASVGLSFLHVHPLAFGFGAVPVVFGISMPTTTSVRGQMVYGPLQQVSIAYKNRHYICNDLFPIIERVAPKAKLLIYPPGAWFRDEAGVRAPSTRSRRGSIPYSGVPIAFEEWSFAKEVTDEDRTFADEAGSPPILLDQDAVEYCADKIDLRKERIISQLVFNTTWADGNAGGLGLGGSWLASPLGAAPDTCTFLKDVTAGIKTIKAKTGMTPNRLMLDLGTMLNLKQEPSILDKIKYTQRGVLTPDLLAALLELDMVLVGDAIYSSSNEKADESDFTAVNIWEKNQGKGSAFLYYAPPRVGLKVPMAGLQARGAYVNGLARRVMTWREEAEHQNVFEVAEETDILVAGDNLGYLFTNTLAA